MPTSSPVDSLVAGSGATPAAPDCNSLGILVAGGSDNLGQGEVGRGKGGGREAAEKAGPSCAVPPALAHVPARVASWVLHSGSGDSLQGVNEMRFRSSDRMKIAPLPR